MTTNLPYPSPDGILARRRLSIASSTVKRRLHGSTQILVFIFPIFIRVVNAGLLLDERDPGDVVG